MRSGVQRDCPKRHGERVYRDVSEASDSASVFVPDVLDGDLNATRAVLKELDIPFKQDWSTDKGGKSVWGKAVNSGNAVTLRGDNTPMEIVPDVKGMGRKTPCICWRAGD